MRESANSTETECRTEEGITVGLIDGMIAIIRILRKRNFSSKPARHALIDFTTDRDLQDIFDLAHKARMSMDFDDLMENLRRDLTPEARAELPADLVREIDNPEPLIAKDRKQYEIATDWAHRLSEWAEERTS